MRSVPLHRRAASSGPLPFGPGPATGAVCPAVPQRIRGLLLLLLMLLPGGSVIARGPEGGSGSDTSHLRARAIDALHYRIHLIPDLPRGSYRGRCDIRIRLLRHAEDIRLDAVGLRIDSVLDGAGVPLSFRTDSVSLHVELPHAHRAFDTVDVRIRYTGTAGAGVHIIGPSSTFPSDPVQLWTHGQPDDARRWFPCADHPADKATTETLLTIPDSLTAMSNGRVLAIERHADGRRTWHWSLDRPHAPYLVMMAAGRYTWTSDTVDGIPIHSYAYPGARPEDAARSYRRTGDMLRFFTSYQGVPYPWESYSQLPVRHFPYGGMENTTATILSDTRVVLDARTAVDDASSEPLVAHELAHQWWGNWVTAGAWEHLWLHEGLATFLQQLWTAHADGEEAAGVQRMEGIASACAWSDRNGHPPLIGVYENAAPLIYSKGAAVLHLLRDEIGDTAFRRALRRFGLTHAWGAAETRDLRRAMERESGRSLDWFFAQWTERGGYPLLRAAARWDVRQRQLVVTVVQEVPDSGRAPYRLDLPLRISDGARVRDERIRVRGWRTEFRVRLPRFPALVEIDPDRLVPGRLEVDLPCALDDAIVRSGTTAVSRIGAVERVIQRLRDSSDRCTDGAVALVCGAATDDPAPMVRFAAMRLLSDLDPVREDVRDAVFEAAKRASADPHPRVRAAAFNALGRQASRVPREVFARGLADSSVYVEASALTGMLLAGGDAESLLRPRLAAGTPDVVRRVAIEQVAELKLTGLADAILPCARAGEPLRIRLAALDAAAAVGIPSDSMLAVAGAMLPEAHPDARMLAVRALARLAAADPSLRVRVVELLAERLRVEGDNRVAAAIRALFGI